VIVTASTIDWCSCVTDVVEVIVALVTSCMGLCHISNVPGVLLIAYSHILSRAARCTPQDPAAASSHLQPRPPCSSAVTVHRVAVTFSLLWYHSHMIIIALESAPWCHYHACTDLHNRALSAAVFQCQALVGSTQILPLPLHCSDLIRRGKGRRSRWIFNITCYCIKASTSHSLPEAVASSYFH